MTACTGIDEFYEFKSEESDFEWGIIKSDFYGCPRNQGRNTIRSSPYKLFVWFRFDEHVGGIIQIAELKLISRASGKIVFEKEEIEGRLTMNPKKTILSPMLYIKYPYENSVEFVFRDLKLEFEDMELHLKYTLKEGDKVSEGSVVIIFEKDHQSHYKLISA